MKQILFFCFLISSFLSYSQKTKVEGIVTDGNTGEPLPFVKVRFKNSKIGALTDTAGYYFLDTYYATDTLVVSLSGYLPQSIGITLDEAQVVDVQLQVPTSDFEEVVIRPPDEFPSTILHKKVIANKPINDKEKLDAYQYEVYNKVQIDLNNIDDKFKNRGIVQRLDLVMDYLDSTDSGSNFLPMILSENVSEFYYKNRP